LKTLNKFKCECGALISARAALRHVNGLKCKAPQEYKKYIKELIYFSRKNKSGWLKKDGVEATANNSWLVCVLNRTNNIKDFTFTSPRPSGVCPPSFYKKISTNRKGIGNPMCKANKKGYDISELKNFAKEALLNIIRTDGVFSDLKKILDFRFPGWVYDLSNISEDDKNQKNKRLSCLSKQNKKLEYLLDMSSEETLKIKRKLRGNKISKGQLNSKKFKKIASKLANSLISKIRVTKPQKKLFELIKKIDKKSKIEYGVYIENVGYRSFDIYSPKYNCLIEMHGRAWHDINRAPDRLKELVKKNIINDAIKKAWAETQNKKYLIFWDDEMDKWQKQIKKNLGG
jgi:hypothetical protein